MKVLYWTSWKTGWAIDAFSKYKWGGGEKCILFMNITIINRAASFWVKWFVCVISCFQVTLLCDSLLFLFLVNCQVYVQRLRYVTLMIRFVIFKIPLHLLHVQVSGHFSLIFGHFLVLASLCVSMVTKRLNHQVNKSSKGHRIMGWVCFKRYQRWFLFLTEMNYNKTGSSEVLWFL